jgi:uncharacterized protein
MAAAHPEFAVPVAQLEGTSDEHRFTVRPAWVRGVLEDHEAQPTSREGELRVRLHRSGSDIVVQGRLQVELSIPCARCLERFAFPVDKSLSVLMVPASKLKIPEGSKEYEVSPDEADILAYDGETVVLDDLVHDELVLETPMIPLCSEACPGIPRPPGVSPPNEEKPAIDPRLAPLARLKAKVDKS